MGLTLWPSRWLVDQAQCPRPKFTLSNLFGHPMLLNPKSNSLWAPEESKAQLNLGTRHIQIHQVQNGWVVHPHLTTVSIFMDTTVTFTQTQFIYYIRICLILISAFKYCVNKFGNCYWIIIIILWNKLWTFCDIYLINFIFRWEPFYRLCQRWIFNMFALSARLVSMLGAL